MDWWNHILLFHDMYSSYICFPHFNCKTHFFHVRYMYFIIVLFLLYISFIEDSSRTRNIYMIGICTCTSPVLRVLCVFCVHFSKVHGKYTEYTHIEIVFLNSLCVYFYVLYVYSIKYLFQTHIWSILCYFGPRQWYLNDIPWVFKKYYYFVNI